MAFLYYSFVAKPYKMSLEVGVCWWSALSLTGVHKMIMSLIGPI